MDLVSLLERLFMFYFEILRIDKDLRGFWFKEIMIYIKFQEMNRDLWWGKFILNSNIVVFW